MVALGVALISKRNIKPSSPTPFAHRIHKLSMFDQLNPCAYMAYAMFYPNQGNQPRHKITELVEKSLSRTLAIYFPVAGKIVDHLHVECNDTGAEFREVQIDSPMQEIFKSHSAEAEDVVFPTGLPWTPSREHLIVAQINHFSCGGVAVSACVSHRLFDGASLVRFFNDWAAVGREPNNVSIPSAQFVGASLFPPTSDILAKEIVHSKGLSDGQRRVVSKRYLFSHSKLNSLKAMIYTESARGLYPTSIEAITAFLYKCLASKSSRPSGLIQAVNLRSLMEKSLPKNFHGNASAFLFISQPADEKEMRLPRLVYELRKEKEYYFNKYRDANPETLATAMYEKSKLLKPLLDNNANYDVYKCTSLSKFPFSDINFGWGKPKKVSLGSVPINKRIIFMDNQDGDGIEALVSLNEADVSAFESDSQLFEFATPCFGLR